MRDPNQYARLLYQYEILLAKLSVREHFLKTVVREVYENIGQVLSLIRVQLYSRQPGVDSSGELVGQTIRELRAMCRFFYPEEYMLNNQGLAGAIQSEILAQWPGAVCTIPGGPLYLTGLSEDRAVLLYSIVLELLQQLHQQHNGQLQAAIISQEANTLLLQLDYTGAPIRRTRRGPLEKKRNLSIFDRVELLGGTLEIKKTGTDLRRIKLALPIL